MHAWRITRFVFSFGAGDVLFEDAADGPTNMSRDQNLLSMAESGQGRARVYEWLGVWVSIGKFQDVADVLVDPTVPWVKRPTGGGAVLHGQDITVSIAIPVANESRSVKQIYRCLTAPIVESLRRCGSESNLTEHTTFASGLRMLSCFSSKSAHDIVHETSGAKVCGCALKVTRRGALLQASIPFAEPAIPIDQVIRESTKTHVAKWDYHRFRKVFLDVITA